jgi:transposase
MMGTKERNFQPLPNDISLEELVPEDNFYCRLQQKLDLSFVRELVEDRYAASGRPSVDPEVFFRLQLVMFHEGIRSERELMRIVSEGLSVRWYVGYDLHEPLPEHFRASPASGIALASRCSESSSSGSYSCAWRQA